MITADYIFPDGKDRSSILHTFLNDFLTPLLLMDASSTPLNLTMPLEPSLHAVRKPSPHEEAMRGGSAEQPQLRSQRTATISYSPVIRHPSEAAFEMPLALATTRLHPA